MSKLRIMIILPLVLFETCAGAQEHGRIKKKPPTIVEADRIISDVVMNDGTLHKGDIIVPDHGFFLFRGFAADEISNDFVPVPNPLSSGQQQSGAKF